MCYCGPTPGEEPHYFVEILPTLAHFGGAHGSSDENVAMRLLLEGQDLPIGAVRRGLLHYGIRNGAHHLHAVEGSCPEDVHNLVWQSVLLSHVVLIKRAPRHSLAV